MKIEIDEQVKKIVDNPEIGNLKRGELRVVRVHKFKFGNETILISYETTDDFLYLYTIGSHENFYKNLKKYLS